MITGKPTVFVLTEKTYTVTASNTAGSTTINVKLKVIAPAPTLKYTSPRVILTHKTYAEIQAHSTGGNYSAITSCSVSPALPAGLVLNVMSCSIAGRPSVISYPGQNYTVTGSNSGGTATAHVWVTVQAIAPVEFLYSGGKHETFIVGTAIMPDEALINEWSDPIKVNTVTPALPAGLSFNAALGIVTGTPTEVTAKKDYVFTASNSGGGLTFTQTIEVIAAAPAGLKYDGGVQKMNFTLGQKVKEIPSLNAASLAGDASLKYSVSPALPEGLSIDATTGLITGIPTELDINGKTVTVTATDSGGSTTDELIIRVKAVCPKLNTSRRNSD
jgi:hypothetical protein